MYLYKQEFLFKFYIKQEKKTWSDKLWDWKSEVELIEFCELLYFNGKLHAVLSKDGCKKSHFPLQLQHLEALDQCGTLRMYRKDPFCPPRYHFLGVEVTL